MHVGSIYLLEGKQNYTTGSRLRLKKGSANLKKHNVCFNYCRKEVVKADSFIKQEMILAMHS